MITVLIIGANGFIGSYLCRFLLHKGIKVIGSVKDKCSDLSALEACIGNENFFLQYSDIHNIASLEKSLSNSNISMIYYLAWQGITGDSRSNYSMQIDNIKCELDTITFAHKIGCNRFIGIGSLAEIDAYSYASLDGSTPNPVSQYGISKLSTHYMSKILCNQLGIDHLWAVLGNTYGLGDKSNNFINFTIQKISSPDPNDFTSGEQLYDFVNIQDVTEALYYFGLNGLKNNSYYVGSGSPQKLKQY